MGERSRSFVAAPAAMVLAVIISACATAKPSGYPINFERMTTGQHVEKFWYDRAAIESQPVASVVLARIDVSRQIKDQSGLSRDDGAACLRSALVEPDSDTVAASTGSGETARVDLAITEMSTGNAFMRVLAGELGAGHAWVQVEGRVFGERSDQPLAEFVDRRRSSGAIGFRDTFGSAGPQLVCEMLQEIARDLKLELREVLLDGQTAAHDAVFAARSRRTAPSLLENLRVSRWSAAACRRLAVGGGGQGIK